MLQGYIDLKDVICVEATGLHWDFRKYLTEKKTLPENIFHPQLLVEVPLFGLVEVLACAVLLADVDVIGPSFTNVGIVWQYGPAGDVECATAVKVDPGCSFNFVAASRAMQGMTTSAAFFCWLSFVRVLM